MDDFVTIEIAKKLKEKGYLMPTDIVYATYKQDGDLYPMMIVGELMTKTAIAPTIGQVLKWLREDKKIHIATGVTPKSAWRYVVMFCDERGLKEPTITKKNYQDYPSAALAGIEYVLNNLI